MGLSVKGWLLNTGSIFDNEYQGKEYVYEQASKHLEVYHEDVQRFDQHLECTKQQQMVSLQEKIKHRQKLKEAEEEEKQRVGIETGDNPTKDEEKKTEANASLNASRPEVRSIVNHMHFP